MSVLNKIIRHQNEVKEKALSELVVYMKEIGCSPQDALRLNETCPTLIKLLEQEAT